MARKGSQKARTGCLTCKKRKVKCDEAKPSCERCAKAGHTCDGYAQPLPGHYSWAELLRKRPILPAITSRRKTQDGRALDFYHHVVAPGLSRFPGDDFWTRMVSQASMQEPAVRHAVLAFSTIYELVDDTPYQPVLLGPQGRYAMVHYNRALQHLTSIQDENVVLFTCVLFICLEILRDNKMGALTHVVHGIRVYNNCHKRNSAWAADYLRPIFTRLTSCPLFFGAFEQTLPILALPILYGPDGGRVSGHQENYEVARHRLDLLITRTIHFVRKYEAAAPDRPKETPDYTDFEEEQVALVSELDDWMANYNILEASAPPPSSNPAPFLLMRMMYRVLKIWVLVCRETDEMKYDVHVGSFEEVVDLARQAAEAEGKKKRSSTDPAPRSKFVLEMGFIPVLYFVIIKCRKLSLRLAALKYLPLLAPERENLWNAAVNYAVGKKIVEIEHGPLDGDGQVLDTSEEMDAASVDDTSSPGNPERSPLHPPSLLPKPHLGLRVRDVLVQWRGHEDGVNPVPTCSKTSTRLTFIVGPHENPKRVDAALEDSTNPEDRSLGVSKAPYSLRVRVISDIKHLLL